MFYGDIFPFFGHPAYFYHFVLFSHFLYFIFISCDDVYYFCHLLKYQILKQTNNSQRILWSNELVRESGEI